MSVLTDEIEAHKEAIRLCGVTIQHLESVGLADRAHDVRIGEAKLTGELMRLFREQQETEPLPLTDDPIVRKYLIARMSELGREGKVRA